MPFRFRRSFRLLPGIRVNIGKRGVSTSIGERGAHVTLGHGKVRETVSLPGTGLSYTHVSGSHQTHAKAPQPAQIAGVTKRRPWISLAVLIGLAWFFAWLVTHHGGLP